MPETDKYTMVFKKNGNTISKANGGDIIDVELFATDPAFTLLQNKEITNFNIDVVNGNDLSFENATYVDGSISNSIGTQEVDSTGNFLKPFSGVHEV